MDQRSSEPTTGTPLNDEQTRVLTEARTAKWRLETYEFAYGSRIRKLRWNRIVLDFLGVAVAVVFLFLQWLVKDTDAAMHELFSYIGTGLSLVVILMAVWGLMARWQNQIDAQQRLSRKARELILAHRDAVAAPVLPERVRKWIATCEAFEEDRKDPDGAVPRYYLQRGFQHTGNSNPNCGLKCSMCGREWTPEMNRNSWHTWIPFFGCDNCGVKR